MQHATPAQLRKAIEMANQFVKFGIPFVPMPVLNDDDLEQLVKQSQDRLDQIADEAEKE